MSALSPDDQIIAAGSVEPRPKSWPGLAERSVAIMFAPAAVVAMAGWLFLLGEGLWATARWLLF